MAVGKGQINFTYLIEIITTETPLDMSPVDDDSPFFYDFEKGLPGPVSTVLRFSVILLVGAISTPFIFRRRLNGERDRSKVKRNDSLLRFVLYFSAIGIGFMLVEISMVQRFTLFLGQPVLSLSVVLFALLVGAGTGSMFSGRVPAGKIAGLTTIGSLSVSVALLIYAFALPAVARAFLGLDVTGRILITTVLSLPPGFAMGILFPSGIRLLKERGMERYIPWMWGINGIASVAGSVLTITVAVALGFTEVLLLGASAYFAVFLFALADFNTHRARMINGKHRIPHEANSNPAISKT
jgi:hypothetical protein